MTGSKDIRNGDEFLLRVTEQDVYLDADQEQSWTDAIEFKNTASLQPTPESGGWTNDQLPDSMGHAARDYLGLTDGAEEPLDLGDELDLVYGSFGPLM